jgi:4-amino-4-deoxy-L-arabinose transferase-like glycosyltransferase
MQKRSGARHSAQVMLSNSLSRASNTWFNLGTLTTPEQTRPLSPARRTPVSLWLLVVLLFTSYVGYVSKLGALGLTGPDEPRYASIARNMAESNDWVTPRLDGKPWFEKPILYYWEAAASFKVLGENDYAARFPSALAAILAAAAMCWVAWRFYSAATTVLVLLMMPTAIGIIGFSHAATPDMTFAGTLCAAMALGAEIVVAVKPRIWYCVGFGFFIGLATLAKGPAAILLAGGAALLWGVVTGHWKRAFRLAHPVAAVVFLFTAVPWYALCSARNPDFLHTFFVMHNVERFTSPVFHHTQPFWYYVPVMIACLLPWTALAAGTFRDARVAVAEGDWKERPGIYFGCWILFTFLFFSISQSKLPGYLLPAIPPLILILADSAAKMIRDHDTIARWSCAFTGVLWLVLVIAGIIALDRLPPASPLAQPNLWRWWIVAAATGGIMVAALGWSKRIAGALLLNALLLAGMLEAANWKLIPEIDVSISSRPTAHVALAAGLPSQTIYNYSMNRSWVYGLEYYLRVPLPEFPADPDEARKIVQSNPTYLFTTERGCGQLAAQGLVCEPSERLSPQAWLVQVKLKPIAAR